MIEIKRAQDNWVPVRLLDLVGTPITGVAAASVSITLKYADSGSVVTYTPTAPQWIAVDSDSFSGTGVYMILMPSSLVYPEGLVSYAVATAGARTYLGVVKAVTYVESDTYVKMRELQEGRWKIHTSGIDANKLVLYAADGVTAIQKWNLLDSTGTATPGIDVFERVPTMSIP